MVSAMNFMSHEAFYVLTMNPGGDTQQRFKPGASSPSFNLLPFYIPFLSEKVSLSYTFYWQMETLSHA